MSLLEKFQPHIGTTLHRSPSGAVSILTPVLPWSYAAEIDFGDLYPDAIGLRLQIEMEATLGIAGIFLTDRAGQTQFSQETFVSRSGRILLTLDTNKATACKLIVRSGEAGQANINIYSIQIWVRQSFDIANIVDELIPIMLLSPGVEALEMIAERLSLLQNRPIGANEIGKLCCERTPIKLDIDNIFNNEYGKLILKELNRLTSLLPTYDEKKMASYYGYLGKDYVATCLRQGVIRVYKLINMLNSFGISRGTILEVGSLFGQFSLILQRSGFQVTAVDRYRDYNGAYAGYTQELRSAGVTVVEVGALDEAEKIAQLGQFDVVISMAVIEHIPHTPRGFMKMLASHVKQGGILALDTPNIARFWNRKAMEKGLTVHQPVAEQYNSEIPFAGHHREYTGGEMRWILEQVGCHDIKINYFDYNLLQFDELWYDHIQALLEMTVDPTLADTILVGGRIGCGNFKPSSA